MDCVLASRPTPLRLALLSMALTAATVGCRSPESAPTEPASDAATVALPACEPRLTAELLDRSYALGVGYLRQAQRPEGNFTYVYDWRARAAIADGDSQVRQAGALWGLAEVYRRQPDQALGAAVERGLEFFIAGSRRKPSGARFLRYPDDPRGATGTVALVALAHIEYLRGASGRTPDERLAGHRRHLDELLAFLLELRRADGLLRGGYDVATGTPKGKPSPYADGEALLALVKAARYLGRDDLVATALEIAAAGHHHWVAEALLINPKSSFTKGYYQWGSMAFFEIATSSWPGREPYAGYVLEMADWIIGVHGILDKTRNTGYAYEGIVHAHELARLGGDQDRVRRYLCTIREGLYELTSWQVGSPVMNDYIRADYQDDPAASGGVQNHCCEPFLRIDTVQHQLNAVALARRYLFGQWPVVGDP